MVFMVTAFVLYEVAAAEADAAVAALTQAEVEARVDDSGVDPLEEGHVVVRAEWTFAVANWETRSSVGLVERSSAALQSAGIAARMRGHGHDDDASGPQPDSD